MTLLSLVLTGVFSIDVPKTQNTTNNTSDYSNYLFLAHV